jgi:membrane fusion protein (multidrug efflux system)
MPQNTVSMEAPLKERPRGTSAPVVKRTAPPRPRRKFRFIVIAICLWAAALVVGVHFLALSQTSQSTDDAFIDGHIINVAPQVSGRVAHVLIADNQEVRKGDVLVELDSRDFDATLRQKQAALASTRAQAAAVTASIDQAKAHVATLQATIESDQATAEADRANADKAAKDLARNQDLAKQKVISPQDLDSTRASAQSSQATLDAALKKVMSDRAQVAEAMAQVNTYIGLHDSLIAQIGQSDAAVQSAQLSQSYTQILAPEDGRVTRKSIEPGAYVQTGQTLLGLVPHDLWVTANFKENQLARIRPGQQALIAVDALSDQKFEGKVDSIQTGSGARFSLLPPENATGNYVKVVQRVPVKIVFTQLPGGQLPLGPGESVVPTIQVQAFHYTTSQVIGTALLFGLGAIGIVWWGTRSARRKLPGRPV